MLFYKIPNPDQAMLISGGRAGKGSTAPFRVVTGRGALVVPIFRKAAFLTLAMQEAEISELCYSQQGIELSLRAVMAFKVGTTDAQIVNAGQRFVTNQGKMVERASKIFAGHLRSVVGGMTVEDIITKRQTLADEVLDASKTEMEKLGLVVDSFQIESVDDQGVGYIAAMAAPHTADIQRAAKVAQAEADRAAAEAQQVSARNQADYARQTAVTEAGYAAEKNQAQAKSDAASQSAQAQAEAEIAEAQAEQDRRQRLAKAKADAEAGKAAAVAAQAGPLAQAEAQQQVTEAQTKLATQAVALRKQELQRDVVEPAEAAKRQRIAQAEAEAEATKLAATAAASENRVSLDSKIIDQLPQMAAAVADGLKGANLNILNGTDGLSEVATGLIAQIGAIYEAARSIHASATSNGQPTEDSKAAIAAGGQSQ